MTKNIKGRMCAREKEMRPSASLGCFQKPAGEDIRGQGQRMFRNMFYKYTLVYPCACTHNPGHMHTSEERLANPVQGRSGHGCECRVAEMRRRYLGCLSGPQEGAHTIKLALCAQLELQKRALKSNSKEGIPRGTYLKLFYNFMREMLKCCPGVCTNERKERIAVLLPRSQTQPGRYLHVTLETQLWSVSPGTHHPAINKR